VVRNLIRVREVWDSNPEPIKSPTRCQRLATVATWIVWALAQSRGDGHRSLVTPEMVLSEYNKDLIFIFLKHHCRNINMRFFWGGCNIHEWQRHISYTYMCTGRKVAASEHQTLNPTVTSPTRYRYTNFVAKNMRSTNNPSRHHPSCQKSAPVIELWSQDVYTITQYIYKLETFPLFFIKWSRSPTRWNLSLRTFKEYTV